MYCENCGARLSEGAAYCAACGAPAANGGEKGEERKRRTLGDRLSALAGRTRRERLLAAGTVGAIVVAIVGFALLDTTDEEPRQDGFTRAADRLCLTAKQGIAAAAQSALGDDAPGGRERYAAAMLDTVTSWKVGFDQLEPTPGHVAESDRLDAAMLRVIIELGALARVSREGDEGRISQQAARTDEATAELEQAIAGLGLQRCAAAKISPTGPR